MCVIRVASAAGGSTLNSENRYQRASVTFMFLLVERMMHVLAAALLCLNLVHAFITPSSHAAFGVVKQAHSSKIAMQAHKVTPCVLARLPYRDLILLLATFNRSTMLA